MAKRFYLFLVMMICISSAIAQNPAHTDRVFVDKKDLNKKASDVREALRNNRAINPHYRDGDNTIVNTTILSEDFSNFTAGSIESPDGVRLDDPETSEIADTYFNTPGWYGLEVYQAGGCAFIKFSEDYGETGMLITPLLNTQGDITIKCRMKSVNPEGDYIGYNIASENFEAIDSNIGYLLDDEWTDVEWFTSYGDNNSYIYLFSYEFDLYIDDIEIIHHYMPAPTFLPETNITDTSFTANWQAIEGADEYNVFFYLEHTAESDETFNLADFNFNDIASEGTEDNPVIPEEGDYVYNSWYTYLHVFIDGAIGLSGEGSEYWDYSYMSSPELDLSSDNGNVTISFRAKAEAGENFDIFLYSADYDGYYEEADYQAFTTENDQWNEYTFELTGGKESSIIELYYYGMNFLYIDDLKVSQNLSKGEVKTVLLQDILTQDTSIDFVIDEKYRNDDTFYKLYAIKYVYAYDPSWDEYYITGGITSDFTEPRYSPTNSIGINDIDVQSAAHAYFSNEQLYIFNPDNEIVSVYNINGVCLYNATANGAISLDIPNGIYIVKIGGKVIKAVNN